MTIVASNSLTISKVNDGVGVTSTVITYANSTSGTTAPSTGWTSSIPSPVKGQYLWTKTVWTSTDSSSKIGYSVSYISKDGTNGTDGTSGIIVSSVAPDSPQTGQLWQDTSTTPQLVKKWTGSSWVIWELYVENMNANNLSALSTNLGNITGGTLKLMDDDLFYNGRPKMYGIYQSKLGLISSGPTFETAGSGLISDTQMGVVSVNKGEMRFIVTDYTEDLKTLQESGMSDQDHGFIKFASYEGGKDTMMIGSSGDIVFSGNVTDNSDWQWFNNDHYARYKKSFGYVSIYYDCSRASVGNILLGNLPVDCRPPLGSIMTTAKAFATSAVNDRNMQINWNNGGGVTILNAVANQKYASMYTFKL